MDLDSKTLDDADREALGLEPLDDDEAEERAPVARTNGKPKMSKAEKARQRYREAILAGGTVPSDLADDLNGTPEADRKTLSKRREAAANLERAATLRAELAELDGAPTITLSSKLADFPTLTVGDLVGPIVEAIHPGAMSPAKRRRHDLESTALSLETEARATLYNTASDQAKAAVAKCHGRIAAIRTGDENAPGLTLLRPIACGDEVRLAEHAIEEIKAGRGLAHRLPNETNDIALSRLRTSMAGLKQRQEKARLRMAKLTEELTEAQTALAQTEAVVWDPEAGMAFSIDKRPEPFRVDQYASQIGLEGTGWRRPPVAV